MSHIDLNLDLDNLKHAASISRGLSMDAVAACKSGHLGLPLGCADIGSALFGNLLSYHPAHDKWINRDRFVLSAGHGSMFLYSWLHLAGYKVSLQDVKDFRKLGSITPGHPEFNETPGVEATTGPLGTGVSSAVGIAAAQKMSEARFNTPEHKIFDAKTVVLAGDGCMQEGVSHEACSFAAHEGLDNLIVIYDSNQVTLDAMAEKTQSEDTGARFKAYGWDVVTIDGHDIEAFAYAYALAHKTNNNKPKLIIIKTVIGFGIKEVQGTNKAHGEGGVKYIADFKTAIGLNPAESFAVTQKVQDFFSNRRAKLQANYDQWEGVYNAWKAANPSNAALIESALNKPKHADVSAFLAQVPAFPEATEIATRKASESVLQEAAKYDPLLVSGSADLHGSTLNYIKGAGDFSKVDRAGRNFYFGIREFGMGCIVNGIAYHGIFRPSGATFFTFSDFLRPAFRLGALAHLPYFHIFTHDSVGVGEDGPTHQPVETLAAVRAIPNLDVVRPADPEETVGAYAAALENNGGPTLLVLSRQNVPNLNSIPVQTRREGVLKGGYIAVKETAELKVILISAGAELQHAMKAAVSLGPHARVVSLPSFKRFDAQSAEYKESVLPKSVRARVAIEAAVSQSWYKYTGLDGEIIGIDRFGASGPGAQVFAMLGINADSVVAAANRVLANLA
ncbi:transketolase [Chytriomyces sp. MP71]|nr:transketolase [Chytriomyces sp. MP71]